MIKLKVLDAIKINQDNSWMLKFQDLNIGDEIRVLYRPTFWSSELSKNSPLNIISYPHTIKIVDIDVISYQLFQNDTFDIVIKCNNDYGWNISECDYKLFEIIKKSRKSRLDTLNI
jgi:hypothetical protein